MQSSKTKVAASKQGVGFVTPYVRPLFRGGETLALRVELAKLWNFGNGESKNSRNERLQVSGKAMDL